MHNYIRFIVNDELARNVWLSKYQLEEVGDSLWSDIERRYSKIASVIANTEQKFDKHYYDDLFYYLRNGFILPGGSILSGIANPNSLTSLSNCFVIGGAPWDSYGSIMKSDEEMVQLMKRRGGVGHDISHYRPSGTEVSNAAKTSSGAVSFTHRFSNTTREVAQDGRRGALMLSISIKHPDADKFINVKRDLKNVTGANISVRITDDFMKAVIDDKPFMQVFPVDTDINKLSLSEDRLELNKLVTIEREDRTYYVKKIMARKLFDLLVQASWASAEPGILFWDTIERYTPSYSYGKHGVTVSVPKINEEIPLKPISTNPCGEIPLSPYSSCILLSINLTKFVKNAFRPNGFFDLPSFEQAVKLAIRTLDNIVELELRHIQRILLKLDNDVESDNVKRVEVELWNKVKTVLENIRRIGLSAIGHGDVFAMLGMKYGSEEAMKLTNVIHKSLRDTAYMASIELAKERGPFPLYDAKIEEGNPFLEQLPTYIKEEMKKYGRRNISLLTIPPTGTISLLAGITSGIEPVFSLRHVRRKRINTDSNKKPDYVDSLGDAWEEYTVFHPGFKEWVETSTGKSIESFSEEEMEELMGKSPYSGSTASEINPIDKVHLQATIQKYIDHSISVTTNLPKNTTQKQVADIFVKAWETGCKGITIYREGSRDGILVTNTMTKPKTDNKFHYSDAFKRPRKVVCDILYPTFHGEKYVMLVGLVNDLPYEVFAFKELNCEVKINKKHKRGVIVKVKSKHYRLLSEDEKEVLVENIVDAILYPSWGFVTRMVSLALRHGADVTWVADQLNDEYGNITDVSKVIARQLRGYSTKQRILNGETCPVCGAKLVMEGGCVQCKSCGYGKCE